jgi:hypothetical protein
LRNFKIIFEDEKLESSEAWLEKIWRKIQNKERNLRCFRKIFKIRNEN